MSEIGVIAKNTLVLGLSQVVTLVLGLVYMTLLARYLGSDNFGILSLAIAIIGIFILFTDLGINTLTVREVSRNKSNIDKYIKNILFIKILLIPITLILICLYVQLAGYNDQIKLVSYIMSFSLIFTAFTNVFYSLFQIYEKMEYQAIGTMINSILLFVGVFIAIKYNFNVVSVSEIYLLVSFLVFVYNLFISINIEKYVKPGLDHDIRFCKDILKNASPFAINSVFINIYLYINLIILSTIVGTTSVGFYNASLNITLMLLFVPMILNTSVFPAMSRFYVTSPIKLNLAFQKLFKIMIFIAIPMGIGVTFIAKNFILLLYGEQYEKSIIILQILIWSATLIFMRNPFERLLEVANKQVVVTKIFVVAAIFNIVLCLILIPRYDYIGACIALLLTNFIILLLQISITGKMGYKINRKEIKNFTKIIIACVPLVIFLSYFNSYDLIPVITISCVIYIIASVILKIIDKEDLTILLQLIDKKKRDRLVEGHDTI